MPLLRPLRPLRVVFLALALGLFSAFGLYSTQSYRITEDYSIKFEGRGAEGTFSGLTGTIAFAPEALGASRIDVSVDAATIETGNQTKDGHARGEDWFDVAKYPRIAYKATAFAKTLDGFVAKGTLTMHGVSKPVDLPFSFTPTPGGGGVFIGGTTVDRESFGIEGPWLGFAVSDELAVEIRVVVE